LENSFRRWQFWIDIENVLHKYDIIMVYYYFSFLGFVHSQNFPNAMKKTFNYKKFPWHQKGPKTKKIDTKNSGKTCDEDNLRKYL
jgi:hypothetical protein